MTGSIVHRSGPAPLVWVPRVRSWLARHKSWATRPYIPPEKVDHHHWLTGEWLAYMEALDECEQFLEHVDEGHPPEEFRYRRAWVDGTWLWKLAHELAATFVHPSRVIPLLDECRCFLDKKAR